MKIVKNFDDIKDWMLIKRDEYYGYETYSVMINGDHYILKKAINSRGVNSIRKEFEIFERLDPFAMRPLQLINNGEYGIYEFVYTSKI